MEFMRRIVKLTLLLVGCVHTVAGAQVVLNEVLANEPGGSTALEWVELYNSDTLTVNLSGWKFIEDTDTTILSSLDSIAPKGYLILAKKLIATPPDSNSFEGKWGDGSGVWGDSPREDFPAVEAKMSLTNSTGAVTLISPDSVIQSFSWSRDAGDGISWEKVEARNGDDSANWKGCTLPEGSTPGKINSVTSAANDLTIIRFYSEPDNPDEHATFNLKVEVQNAGSSTSLANNLTLFDDLNFNAIMDRGEELSAANIPQLSPAEVFTVNSAAILMKGNHRLIAFLDVDDKVYNNQKYLDLKVGEFLPEIIINEIMAAPDLSKNQTEWVELYNRSQQNVNLKGWLLGDSKKQSAIAEDLLELQPGQFLILAEDQSKFLQTFPSFTGQVTQLGSWQTLDNDGDEVILKDSLGFVAEKVSYLSQNLKGVSWERIDYERSAGEVNNWWRCVDSVGATPGKQNSVQAGFSSKIELKIEPNPFSPDEDGFDDQTEIEFTIPLGVELTMKIYDRKGRLVRTLFENEPKVSGKINWDGKKDDGSKVRSGVYILFVEAKGDKREVKKATIAVTKQQ